jgi:protein gp37
MAENSIIAWTNNTFNPWMGCVKVSAGCKNCYAETLTKNRMGLNLWGPGTERKVTTDAYWRQPFSWAREARKAGERRRVFCGSLCDVFEDHPTADEKRPELWEIIKATPELDWQLLTKRPENIAARLPKEWPLPNVWLGTSIEDKKACARRDILVTVPAVVHFLSLEPLLEDIAPALNLEDIEWALIGGESGPGFRPMDPQWARNLQESCKKSGTAFFFKQSAAFRTEMGIELDGQIARDYPKPKFQILQNGGSDEADRNRLSLFDNAH